MFYQTPTAALIDSIIPVNDLSRRIARDVALIVGFSLFISFMARFVIHLPFTPVPITGQTLAVLLTGAALGSWRGASVLALYLVEGSFMPVFAGSPDNLLFQASAAGYIFGFSTGGSGLVWNMASGGYIIGFIPAAFVVGFLSEHGLDRRVWIFLAMLAGNIILYIPGLIQLGLFFPGKALEFGLYPFILGDLVKLYIASLALPTAWALVNWRRSL
ncbi:MAG: biotin transporter BioY [Dehalococcoidia bacterium]|nr:biotin transporter BioY [Dehalococcoidia bacterium]